MSRLVPRIIDSVHSTVTDTSQEVALEMARGGWYLYCATIDSWITQDAADDNPVAAAAAGSMFVPAGTLLPIFGTNGDTLAVLRAGGSNGDCSLTPADLI